MKLIYLEWADALTNSRWFTVNEAKQWGETSDWIVREAGWLIKETKEYIVIAEGWMPQDHWTDEQFVNLHKIPKTWIRKRKVLLISK